MIPSYAKGMNVFSGENLGFEAIISGCLRRADPT
jgi:hypothetical protein